MFGAHPEKWESTVNIWLSPSQRPSRLELGSDGMRARNELKEDSAGVQEGDIQTPQSDGNKSGITQATASSEWQYKVNVWFKDAICCIM
jgi:hypothetical protein